MTLDEALKQTPVIAIIRGVRPEESLEIAEALIAGGVRVIEVPLNSPDPIRSVERLAVSCEGKAVIGGGTVLTVDDVDRVAGAGGRIMVAPNTNTHVIERALKRGLTPFPGWHAPSEAFTALSAGATRLKLFPAATGGPQHLKAIRAVLPSMAEVYAVGGAHPADWSSWRAVGAAGLGLGSELYKAGQSPEETQIRARKAVAAFAQTGAA